MKGLLLRLSEVDADAEAAVRVIAYFDELVARQARLSDLVRATAALAGCVAGLRREGVPSPLRFTPDGEPAADAVTEPASADLGEPPGKVWLERAGSPGPLDDLVLERFAMAARVLGRAEPGGNAPHLADPALVELLLGEQAGEEDRARALRLLGLAAGRPVRVLAVGTEDGRDPGAAAVGLLARGGSLPRLPVATVGEVAAVLLQPRDDDAIVGALRSALADRARERDATGGVRVGVGDAVPGLEARHSWLQARLAERFAVPAAEPIVVHGDLGSLTLLAEVPVARLQGQDDVLALDALAATPTGAADVAALEAFCRTGSLRQAAVALHRHHSSVAARLAHVEDALGWRLDEPGDRFRARLALLARRLAQRG
ncbi:LysR family transcriptional regulator [Amycolatopsis sp. WAC 01416]|uniref:PucR family transcriptional regulator n=1 Tax=Amycolatopsis sp. WAC 01416 TaxID=2203196 RepID=UPI000F7B26EF|nr:helix-turn-helix domain-containing protein [Amycolatopsis sp. WAC 01416]RSN27362.1 LysR family transcriptional regulator [Amycolatopsis sp. WAC 01416]